MIGLPLLMRFNALFKVNPCSYIKYAAIHDEERDIPAQQWTNTTPPAARALLMNITAFMKWAPRFSHGASKTCRTLYLN